MAIHIVSKLCLVYRIRAVVAQVELFTLTEARSHPQGKASMLCLSSGALMGSQACIHWRNGLFFRVERAF
ncbi:MAG TPA: hypothetical protein DCQ06_06715 [Myxococcales bacterium]|nr:hypothetical protein [Myxococcales bacterium]HAN31275.1 hypothetical protein [Myxococcales bacterium]